MQKSTIRLIRLAVVLAALVFFAYQHGWINFNSKPKPDSTDTVSAMPLNPLNTPVAHSTNKDATANDAAAPSHESSTHIQLGTLKLDSCELGPVDHPRYATITAYCADIQVPENWSQPHGRAISLHIAWLPAKSANSLPDPLIFLDGGPGGAATEDYPALSGELEVVNSQRGILLIDQRGTGRSHPLHCDFNSKAQTEQHAPLPTRVKQCLDGLSVSTDVAMYTTTATIQDVDYVRALLAIQTLNLYSVSYGTRVAQQYAARYPEHVRSIILDSPVPNRLALGQDHALNIDAALNLQFDRCQSSPQCQHRFNNNMSAALALKAKLSSPKLVNVNDPWDNHPRSVSISADSYATTIRLLAYNATSSSIIPFIIAEANQDRWQPLATAQLLVERGLSPIGTNNVLELSVICSEDASALTKDARNAHTLLGNGMLENLNTICPLWPKVPTDEHFHDPFKSNIPTLVLVGSDDPITPPRYSSEILKSLPNGRSVLFKGSGHTQILSICGAPLLKKFVETASVASLPDTCLNQLGPTPPFVSINGPTA